MNDVVPAFRLERRLLGVSRVSGLVHDRFGKLRQTFAGTMQGTQEAGGFTLNEVLHYDDGRVDRRTWRLSSEGSSGYLGHATDSVGAVLGSVAGNAVNLRYTLLLPIAGKPRKVRFDDWMYLQPDGLIIDRATFRLWGIVAGTVTAVIAPSAG
jgi:hypothetical protein